MYNLYLKNKKGKFIAATEKPFQAEAELEKYIMETREVLSDVFILKRQVNVGKDIPDMVGIDKDNNIVIIENKNVIVTEDILSQIVRYAIWAETNPDSIKAMWLENEDRPDIEIDWENVGVRVIILAPSIKLSVPRLLNKINYTIDLIEVRRFLIGEEEVILLNRLEKEQEAKARAARGLEVYDKAFYKTYRNPRSVDKFFAVADEIEKFVERKGWKLEKKFNKFYMGFKSGFRNVFGVYWIGSKSFGLFFKLPMKDYKKIKSKIHYETEYDERWEQVIMKYEEDVDIKQLRKLFEASYQFFAE